MRRGGGRGAKCQGVIGAKIPADKHPSARGREVSRRRGNVSRPGGTGGPGDLSIPQEHMPSIQLIHG